MSLMFLKNYFAIASFFVLLLLTTFFVWPILTEARNISQYKNTISTSAPGVPSNHEFSFRINTPISPGGVIEITPPAGFEVFATSTFTAERNVKMSVNGNPRTSGEVLSSTSDLVEIFSGSPGMIRYTLNTISGIAAGSQITLKIGNNTSESIEASEFFDEIASTTVVILGDESGIINATSTGTYRFDMRIRNGITEVANAFFSIALVESVGVRTDTTETIPPVRFNGQPEGQVSATSLFVELTLETDEFANCRYSLSPDIPYSSMTNQFTNPGGQFWIFHTAVVPIVPNSNNNYYIRCIDDENNVNFDDFIIAFQVDPTPTGQANTDGSTSGDGSGTGNQGGGDGSGSGGQTGDSSGEAPLLGGSAGTGGAGGGGGGGGGGGAGSTAGGGFETTDGPFESGDGRVIISGFSIPSARVSVLVDGRVAREAVANSQGAFSITIDGISRGAYTFGVYATDSNGTRTSTYSTSFTVSGARASSLSNILITPSVRVQPDPVPLGTDYTISGFAIPNATVTIETEREGSPGSRQTLTATSNAAGAWSVSASGAGLTAGTYKVRARAAQASGTQTNFSQYTFYGVGQTATVPRNADLNRDGRVNLVDFSILLFWWGTDGGNSNPPADINSDNRVNLTDFSILLFNWTG
jgi:hypothetical protein